MSQQSELARGLNRLSRSKMIKLKGRFKPKPAKLRKSISAGTVLIVLSGRFRGKRVIFLKQLSSGLLLVTGPYEVNGVPLRRLNQAYVIATSTNVDVSAADVSDIDDEFFAKQADQAVSREEEFSLDTHKVVVSDARKAAQAKVDGAISSALDATPLLREYLKSKFSLRTGLYPHAMRF